jgi:hypothetical protein
VKSDENLVIGVLKGGMCITDHDYFRSFHKKRL